jgi:hypothetical protein
LRIREYRFLLAVALAGRAAAAIHPLPRFPILHDALTITRPVQSTAPFSVTGESSAILGEQSGTFEAWLYPVKILSHFNIVAALENYPVPIEFSGLAATIEVSPAATVITYSHAAFTVRQIMFAPGAGANGIAILFEIASTRRLTLTFRFQPEMLRMWPAPNYGLPNAEWVQQPDGGYYVLHTDSPDLMAAVAMPRTQPGILAPYQERPRTWPTELKLSFDPKRDSGLIFPLLLVSGDRRLQPARELEALNNSLPRLYSEVSRYYGHFFDTRVTADTPDGRLNQALRWAEIAIDQGRVRHGNETGLVAGYNESGDSARPGFAWFFGRDSLFTASALDSEGDFALTKQILEFLLRRQRGDGKIMHEYAQTADMPEALWNSTPYFYAAADSTPLFVMTMEDYVRSSGDLNFLRMNWEAVKKAYAFTRAHDSDGDGIYDNSEGTGWVESWPVGMPHQEIYLAALDQQSADSMSRLAALMRNAQLSASAGRTAAAIRGRLEQEYFEPQRGSYAFSRNANGALDRTASVFPAIAWWSGRFSLAHPETMLDRWASSEFSTDWGMRDVSTGTAFYDPISYHQGSVWPLYTGWTSLAEYRAGRLLSGYSHLMQNINLTWAQAPGAITELLSGEFFQPLGRSTPHQIWSSAMVVTPVLRGLFGIEADALHRTLRLSPHLPATWDHAQLHNVPMGDIRLDLEFARAEGHLTVRARTAKAEVLCLLPSTAAASDDCRTAPSTLHELLIPLPPVELEITLEPPQPGTVSHEPKVIRERESQRQLDLILEAVAGSDVNLRVRLNQSNVRVRGAELVGPQLRVRMPDGAGYRQQHVTLSW